MKKQKTINSLITIINIVAVLGLVVYAFIGYLGFKWQIDNDMVIPHMLEMLRNQTTLLVRSILAYLN